MSALIIVYKSTSLFNRAEAMAPVRSAGLEQKLL
jgi:hypothetical protein